MKVKIFFVLLAVVFFINFIQSSFVVDQSYLQEEYSLGQGIICWADISFDNQSFNSIVVDSFGNKISLSSLLNLNSNYVYVFDNSTGTINSTLQRIYFDNTSFVVPFGKVGVNYSISLDNGTILYGNIIVEDKEGLIQEMISDKRKSLNELNVYLSIYDVYLSSKISLALDISQIEDSLDEIESSYNSSTSLIQYDQILNDLSKLNIPKISESASANSIFLVSNKSKIDLDLLANIGGGNYTFGRDDEYKDYIIFWNQEHLKPIMTFKEISSSRNGSVTPLLSYFDISFTRPSSKVFLIIENLENLDFKQDYNELSKDGNVYIDLSKIEENIVFTTTDEIDFLDLPFFIAPSLSVFSLEDASGIIDSETESKVSKWVLFILIIIFLIILFIISYILLKTWYDRKYENYLFKNRNHLYNLVLYINSAKRRGSTKSEIEKALKKAKWSNEQIRYVMRKYHGKRTGLWVPSLLSKKKMDPRQHKS